MVYLKVFPNIYTVRSVPIEQKSLLIKITEELQCFDVVGCDCLYTLMLLFVLNWHNPINTLPSRVLQAVQS